MNEYTEHLIRNGIRILHRCYNVAFETDGLSHLPVSIRNWWPQTINRHNAFLCSVHDYMYHFKLSCELAIWYQCVNEQSISLPPPWNNNGPFHWLTYATPVRFSISQVRLSISQVRFSISQVRFQNADATNLVCFENDGLWFQIQTGNQTRNSLRGSFAVKITNLMFYFFLPSIHI